MPHDAVVVGAGPNGLVAANLLADRGWDVLVLEAQPEVGGAVRTDTEVHPDFHHDTFSAFYPLAAASRIIGGLGLERHGLTWTHAPAVLGHPLPDGDWALLLRDREETALRFDKRHAGDGEAWLDLCTTWDRVGGALVDALLTPFPPVRASGRLLSRLPRTGGLDVVRTLLLPARELALSRFGGEAPQLLLAGNAAHADIPLEAPGSGLMALLLTMLAQHEGFPVPVGGAGALTAALARRFTSLGGEIRCGHEVVRLGVERGRVRDVVLADGERVTARRAVIACVSAPALFQRMLDPSDLPDRVARGMRDFQLDPATVKVDWALDGPVPWASPPDVAPGTVHVADSVTELAASLGLVASGGIPDRPFLLTGQMTTTDPTRSPAGTEALWAYTHVPQGSLSAADETERFADRMQARFEELAPGFESRVLARRVLGGRDLEARDANLIGGAIGGGTAQLHQQLVFRPVPGAGRAETGIGGLYLGSASAHPGGGVHGACGANAARAALFHHRARALIPGRRT